MSMILVQLAGGAHERILRLTEPFHDKYCTDRVIIYDCVYPRNVDYWSRYPAILEWMRYYYKVGLLEPIVYLDADTLIVGNENLADALPPDCDCGGVLNRWNQVNTGALWFRATQAAMQLVTNIIDKGPVLKESRDAGGFDQARFNVELPKSGVRFWPVDSRWNSYKFAAKSPCQSIQVVAWHGLSLTKAEQEIQRLTALLSAH